jgi:hypothetical protein
MAQEVWGVLEVVTIPNADCHLSFVICHLSFVICYSPRPRVPVSPLLPSLIPDPRSPIPVAPYPQRGPRVPQSPIPVPLNIKKIGVW